ncbi:uncharacterized protein LOC131927885 [Physella acuta]|uniref:uncharacterized protein LOC131927885 n=1 Tax=Physella acuta TaxID=109671 RepID=UPI0027DC8538|nr:uncharacterized protein LOC131927885 [Physella acuta]
MNGHVTLAILVVCWLGAAVADEDGSRLSPPRPAISCVDQYSRDACLRRPNGDYPLCSHCQYGYYATCSNEILYLRPCPDAYYNGNRFVAKMVFNVYTRDCQKYAPNCPRY